MEKYRLVYITLKCATVVYFISLPDNAFGISIDIKSIAPGRGIDVVNGLNSV